MPWASNSVIQNTNEWMRCVHSAEKPKLLPNFLRVRYEDLINKPEDEILRICEFSGLSYKEEMLSETQTSKGTTIRDEWWFQRATKPLQTGRIGKWKDELTQEQVAIIEWIAGDTMMELGYSPSDHKISVRGRFKAKFEAMKSKVDQYLQNPSRLWYFWTQTTQLAKEEAAIDRRR
jgi:hypothetical protein